MGAPRTLRPAHGHRGTRAAPRVLEVDQRESPTQARMFVAVRRHDLHLDVALVPVQQQLFQLSTQHIQTTDRATKCLILADEAQERCRPPGEEHLPLQPGRCTLLDDLGVQQWPPHAEDGARVLRRLEKPLDAHPSAGHPCSHRRRPSVPTGPGSPTSCVVRMNASPRVVTTNAPGADRVRTAGRMRRTNPPDAGSSARGQTGEDRGRLLYVRRVLGRVVHVSVLRHEENGSGGAPR